MKAKRKPRRSRTKRWPRKLRKRLSPYRRLELDLQDARETIRVAAGQVVDLHYALTDAVNLLDHPPSAWTHADAMRLERIRKLAEKI